MDAGGKTDLKLIRTCSTCQRGIAISINNDILCRDKGVVSPDYVCSKHKFAPLLKSNKRDTFKCSDCENFIMDDEISSDSTFGFCQMFRVRPFDGKQKKACSKFTKKKKVEAS